MNRLATLAWVGVILGSTAACPPLYQCESSAECPDDHTCDPAEKRCVAGADGAAANNASATANNASATSSSAATQSATTSSGGSQSASNASSSSESAQASSGVTGGSSGAPTGSSGASSSSVGSNQISSSAAGSSSSSSGGGVVCVARDGGPPPGTTVRGTLSIPGVEQGVGPIHVIILNSDSDDRPLAGTTVDGPGPFELHGIENSGDREIIAWRGAQNLLGRLNTATQLVGRRTANLPLAPAEVNNIDIAMTGPDVSPPGPALGRGLVRGPGLALVLFGAPRPDGGTIPHVETFQVRCLDSGGGLLSQITAHADDWPVWVVRDPAGVLASCTVEAFVGATGSGAQPVPILPVNPSPPLATVTGPVTYPDGGPQGAIIVGLSPGDDVPILGLPVTSPNYEVPNVPAGDFNVFGFWDRNNNGLVEPSDHFSGSFKSIGGLEVAGVDINGPPLTFIPDTPQAAVETHLVVEDGDPPRWDATLHVVPGGSRLLGATVYDGPGVTSLRDMAMTLSEGGPMELSVELRLEGAPNFAARGFDVVVQTEAGPQCVSVMPQEPLLDVPELTDPTTAENPVFRWAPPPGFTGPCAFSFSVFAEDGSFQQASGEGGLSCGADDFPVNATLQKGIPYRWSVTITDKHNNTATATRTLVFRDPISVEPVSPKVNVGGQLQLRAKLGGQTVPAVWSMPNPILGGFITADGLYFAPAAAGTQLVEVAMASDPLNRLVVSISVGAFDTVNVSPPLVELSPGQQFSFAAVWTSGGPSVTWSIDGPCTELISTANTVTVLAGGSVGGTCYVVATDGTVQGAAVLRVSAGPPLGLEVTPGPAVLIITANQQVTFTAKVHGTPHQAVTWTVTGGGTIGSDGVFDPGGDSGPFMVRARSDVDPAVESVISVNVDDTAVIEVLPGGVRMEEQEDRRFRARVGGIMVTTGVDWSAAGCSFTGQGDIYAPGGVSSCVVTATPTAGTTSGNATVEVFPPSPNTTTLFGLVDVAGQPATAPMYVRARSGDSVYGSALVDPGSETWTIRGISTRSGTMDVEVWEDAMGVGRHVHAANRYAVTTIALNNNARQEVPLTLGARPVTNPGTTTFGSTRGVCANQQGAIMVSFNPLRDLENRDLARRYHVYLSNTVNPGPQNHLMKRVARAGTEPRVFFHPVDTGLRYHVAVTAEAVGGEVAVSGYQTVEPPAEDPPNGFIEGVVAGVGNPEQGTIFVVSDSTPGGLALACVPAVAGQTAFQLRAPVGARSNLTAFHDLRSDGEIGPEDRRAVFQGGLRSISAAANPGGPANVLDLSPTANLTSATASTRTRRFGDLAQNPDSTLEYLVRPHGRMPGTVTILTPDNALHDLGIGFGGSADGELVFGDYRYFTFPQTPGAQTTEFDISYPDFTVERGTATSRPPMLAPGGLVYSPGTGVFSWSHNEPFPCDQEIGFEHVPRDGSVITGPTAWSYPLACGVRNQEYTSLVPAPPPLIPGDIYRWYVRIINASGDTAETHVPQFAP